MSAWGRMCPRVCIGNWQVITQRVTNGKICIQMMKTFMDIHTFKIIHKTMNASLKGYDEIVEMLIDHSNRMSAQLQGIKHGILDVNVATKDGGYTPLMVSSGKGHIDVVRVLLSHPSVDIDCQDLQGVQ
eukprot:466734_1